MGDFDDAVTLTELCKAIKECKRGVSYKDGPMHWYLHRITKAESLQRDILSGRYKLRPGTKVQIYRPKRREAIAPWFKDRVWQRSMCNNGIYDDLTRSLILDDLACQKGKGQDLALRRVIKFLQKLIRKDPKAPIYGAHLDVKKYFPSTPHEAIRQLDLEKISDARYLPYLREIVDSVKDERPEEEISKDPFGPRGTGLGSQINQLHQVALLDDLDHKLKCYCRYYIRYNDDFLILDHDKNIILKARKDIENHLKTLGLTMTDKAGVFIVQKTGFSFLRKRFYLTAKGKIILKLHKDALPQERRVLKHFKEEIKAGRLSMDFVRVHYQSWIAQAEYAGDSPIRAMDRFYTELFREHPQYKRKKRYLYGNCKKYEGASSRSRNRKQAAQNQVGESGGDS